MTGGAPSPAPARRAPRDQADRDRARFELRRNVVVEAGAGTGKTTLLTDRLLFALLAGGPDGRGLDLTRLVALTFTEKAAGEVQVRLSARLADLVTELGQDGSRLPPERAEEARRLIAEAGSRFGASPEAVAAAAASALEKMDRAMIGTIHHFASHLLRLHPLEAGVDPGFEVDTGHAFEELFESEWSLWLDSELGESAPRRGEWLAVLPLVGLEDLAELARALSLEETRQCRPGAAPAMRARLKELAACLERLPAKPKPKGNSKILERAAEAAARLGTLLEACEGRGAWPRRIEPWRPNEPKWPRSWEGDPDQGLYEEALAVAMATGGDEERLMRRCVALVEPFAERFSEKHRRRGLVSYFGLLRRARDLVRDRTDVREALKARFGALFIDEFQDTDPVQGELLLYLAERRGRSARRWDELELEPGKLFVVGDPKQSIYRFRGADIRAYEGFTGLLLAQGALKCDLQTSFRSHAGLCGPVNAAHERLMRASDGLQPAYLPIQPHRETGPSPAVELIAARGAETADEAREREAAWIASWVTANCGPDKPHRFGDVAILLRTTTALGVYLDALKDAAVPYAVEADRYFYGTQEVLDLLNLLRVLDDPDDRASLAGLLRSPLAALDDRELYELKLAGGLDYRKDPPKALAKAARDRLAGLWRSLRRLREAAGREPLGEFVARVFRDTFLVELASAAYFGEQTASNLLKFARLAAEAGDARGSTLKEFIGLVERSVRDSAEEGESPLADEHLDAVRLLTVHKAKGLEWPVVIVPNLAGRPGGGAELPSWRVDWGSGTLGLALPKARVADAAMALLELDVERREKHEAVRLLYVAMTRARDRLLLVGAHEPGGERSFAGLLAAAGAWPGEEAPQELVLDGRRLPVTYVDETPAPARAGRAAPEARPSKRPAALAKAWNRRREEEAQAEAPAVTSATRLASTEKPLARPSFELSEEAGPRSADLRSADLRSADPRSAAPRSAAPRSADPRSADPRSADPRLLGVVCHRVLERWDFASKATPDEAVREACRRLEREGAAASLAGVEPEAAALLAEFLKSPAAAELAGAELLGRELPFVYAEAGTVVRGSIDLLYRAAGKLWIADYKTERVTAKEAAAVAKRHAVQAKVYREAVKRSLGEPCGFRLLFLRGGLALDC